MLRASVAAELAGVPSVSLVCEGFQRQALATGRGLGCDGMALAGLRGHVDAQSVDEMLEGLVEHTLPLIVSGLTTAADDNGAAVDEPSALDVVAEGDIEHINRVFLANGWSDGLPIVPSTRERVEAYLAQSGHDPWRLIGRARPSGRDITVWSVAVNAVMTGCAVEVLPVLLAMAEIIADPAYGVEHSGNTTGADALTIVSGAMVDELGFNSGQGALREGAHANTAVGRWLRLYLRNVCGFTADEHDKATFGNSTRVVLAEHMETLADIGWAPLSSDFGVPADADSVTMVRINSGLIVGSVFGSMPEQIVPYLANALTRVSGWDLTHVFGLGRLDYQPLLVLSPVLARIFARAGWTKRDVQQALFDAARIPADTFERLIGEWSNLTAGRRTLADLVAKGELPGLFAESADPLRLVPVVDEPSKIMIAVAGDPNRTNAYVMSNDGPHGRWTSKMVDRSKSTDLVCRIDRPD